MAEDSGKYKHPSESDIQRLKAEAAKRRNALKQHGCSTYQIGLRGGELAIQCLCCGLGSFNSNDIEQKYCGFCHEWHSEWKEDDRDR